MTEDYPEIPTPSIDQIPEELPLLPVRDIVVFPYMVLPLFVGRDISIKAIEAALSSNRLIFLTTQKNQEVEVPESQDLYQVGTVGVIMRMLKLPDARIKILVQGLTKARVQEFTQTDPFFSARIKPLTESPTALPYLEKEAIVRSTRESLEKIVGLGKMLMPDVLTVIENLDDPGRLADIVSSNLGLNVETTQRVLEIEDPLLRLRRVNEILSNEQDVLSMQQKIQAEAKGEMDKTQREYFLREQLKAIQKELGELDDRSEEVAEFRRKIQEATMPDKVTREAEKQLKRLEKMHQDTAEAGTIRTYLEWMVELPWNHYSEDNLDIPQASRVLKEDHYDLERVKERILEYLAVRKLKAKMKGPILCFVGPPGVGKTSLGKSIARAMGREFVRMSLGGTRDEAEIRGHRRTYVGALPGRIVQGLKQAGTNNPVFMLDEVDKIGTDFRGDPSAALLEVLDPEQNHAFVDHYLGVPVDLSEVMFITTANLTDPILSALRDRMEIIEIPGYSEEEKLGIAQRYLIPRQLEEHGITEDHLLLTDPCLANIISQYTKEAGVRNLERELANVMRKVAKRIAEGKIKRYQVTPRNLHHYLGVPKYVADQEQEKDEIGVSTGLAWTETGGDVLYIEASAIRGKGLLTLTGHLGDVMKESAHAALTYIRSQAKSLGINPDIFAKQDIHVHVPAGAIPKDGPSAGITMATALASCLSNHPVKRDLAMTGEVTLRGRILAIGGLKEKVLAAKRAHIKTIIMPKQNQKDLDEIPKHLLRGLEFIYVENMSEVLTVALRIKNRPALNSSTNHEHSSSGHRKKVASPATRRPLRQSITKTH
ncbi:MAG: endopeptidase La [Nitrospirales bacterium]|nr:endopeptidase La [Nitrospirales bacterium]